MSRLALDTEPPTLPGVFLDRGAYRAGPGQSDRDTAVFDILDLALRCGAQLLARGAAAVDVESAMHAAATTLGLQQVEVDVTYNALWISAVEQGHPVAASRVVRQGAPDYQRLTAVHQLLTDIVAGQVRLEEASLRLDRIESAPRAHPGWVTLLGNGVLAASVAVALGGGWLVALVAGVTGLLIMSMAARWGGPRLPVFFLAGLGGLLAVGVTAALTVLDVPVRPSLVVAASIVVLLPGVALVGSVRDALVGFPVTATGRAVEGGIVVAGIVAGVLVALGIAAAAQVALQIIPPEDAGQWALATRVVAGAFAAASAAVVYQAPWPMVSAALGIGAVGFAVATPLTSVLSSGALATGLAAVVIGAAASLVARRWNTLALVFVVPGIIPLLPGLTIYRGTLLLTAGETVDGLVVLLEAAVGMLALAAGALLGELIVSRPPP